MRGDLRCHEWGAWLLVVRTPHTVGQQAEEECEEPALAQEPWLEGAASARSMGPCEGGSLWGPATARP